MGMRVIQKHLEVNGYYKTIDEGYTKYLFGAVDNPQLGTALYDSDGRKCIPEDYFREISVELLENGSLKLDEDSYIYMVDEDEFHYEIGEFKGFSRKVKKC